MPLVINGFGGGHAHTLEHTHTRPHETDFKKPGARQPLAGMHLVMCTSILKYTI